MLFRKKYAVKIMPHVWGDSWAVLEVWHKGKVIGTTDISRNNLSKSYVRHRAKNVYDKYQQEQKVNRWIDRLPG
jgi:hypothetical protein